MSDDQRAKLRALLQAYAERAAKLNPEEKTPHDHADRRTCGERLHAIVKPVLDAFMTELKEAGHEASVREHIERDDAYPSVALSFTPRRGLASAIIFRYDPRHGIAVQREVKQAPWKGRPTTGTGDRLGTIGITTLSAAWVETKTMTFIEAVLKAN
ncbi:MAG TPA: hypothetical protein VG454_10485 [Gemmatimonadales bacterium]|nr:hypothetical protein [Gemmatimonadales bacterium]